VLVERGAAEVECEGENGVPDEKYNLAPKLSPFF
jgi:hypothetical protein